jgi:hypothetical protein
MKRILMVCLLSGLCALDMFAQAGISAISGTVRDQSGAPIAGAKVTVANESTGIRRDLETNDAGLFSAPALVPSSGYSVEVVKPGFSKYSSKDISLNVGQIIDIPVSLTVASAATSMEVTAEVALIENDKSGVTDVVDQERIDDLPINGRRADTFALLTPGVVRDATFGLVSFHGISSGNAFLTDGNLTTNSFYDENAGRTRVSSAISEDVVQEFEVISDGYSAEYGRAMGGIINTVTRSGTNQYHGTAYWFFRNRTLEAADRYSHDFAPPEWRHQAGATFGGPVKKDKLFFFSNFEVVKRNFPGLNEITSTQISDSTGLHVNPANCVAPATPAQCAAAIAFIQAQIGILVPRSISSVMGFTKLDYHISDRNTLTLSFNIMHWRSPNGIQNGLVVAPSGALLGNNGNSTVETRFANANLVSILSPSMVSNLRFGWFKDRLSDPAISTVPSTGLTYFTVAGATLGAAEAYPRTYPSEQREEIAESLSVVKGSHSFKVGVDFTTTEDWINQLFNGNGAYSYSNLTTFAEDLTGNTTGAKHYSSYHRSSETRSRICTPGGSTSSRRIPGRRRASLRSITVSATKKRFFRNPRCPIRIIRRPGTLRERTRILARAPELLMPWTRRPCFAPVSDCSTLPISPTESILCSSATAGIRPAFQCSPHRLARLCFQTRSGAPPVSRPARCRSLSPRRISATRIPIRARPRCSISLAAAWISPRATSTRAVST